MALYSLHTSSMKRGDGRSAIAAAAYRAGAEIVNERSGLIHDYTRKRGVEHVEIFTRGGVPVPDKSDLWNAAEAAEKRKDGRTAREVLIALPAELDAGQRLALAREMTSDLAERYGVAAQLAVHAPDADGDQRNHHAHILLTTRVYGHDGLGKKAQLEWSGTQCRKNGVAKPADELKMLRSRWADMQNAALSRAHVAERVDHRSLADQGIDRVPQIHVGSMGTEQIRRGTPEHSERASLNLEIISENREVQRLRELLAVEMAAARRADEREQREWDEWTSRTDVDPTSGRIITELAVDACIARERALPENQPPQGRMAPWPPKPEQAAAAPPTPAQYQPPEPVQPQRPAPQPPAPEPTQPTPEPVQPSAAPPPPAAPEPTQPTVEERAQAAIDEVLSTDDRHERAGLIRDAVTDTDEQYSEAFEDAMIAAGVGVHGELSPAAQRRAAAAQKPEKPEPEPEPEPRQEPDWPRPGGDGGPKLG